MHPPGPLSVTDSTLAGRHPSHLQVTHPLNTHPLNTHPLNTHPLNIHPLTTTSQYTLSKTSQHTPSQHIIFSMTSQHIFYITPSQLSLAIHPLNPPYPISSRHTFSTYLTVPHQYIQGHSLRTMDRQRDYFHSRSHPTTSHDRRGVGGRRIILLAPTTATQTHFCRAQQIVFYFVTYTCTHYLAF